MRTPLAASILSLFVCGSALAAQNNIGPQDLSARYRETANRLIEAALADDSGLARLTYLCDRIGNRISGSPALATAVDWSVVQMKEAGLSNVTKIPVKVPHWVRGREAAELLSPLPRPLHMLGLGMSVGTPAEGISADAVVVSSFNELEQLGRQGIEGKIVVFNVPFESYGRAVVYRMEGPSRAGTLGAVAVLVRSVTPLAMQQPHTGTLRYKEDMPKIPAAAITIEDTLLLQRIQDSGETPRVHLFMQAHLEPDADSADVVGEIPGSVSPEEVVVLGGHLDSWDVGQGAQDDGVGVMASLEAVALIRKLGLKPRRTIRVVFWVNEENGEKGADAYYDWVRDHVKDHIAAIEMDGGAERPTGFGYTLTDGVAQPDMVEFFAQIGHFLDRIDAGKVQAGGGGADIQPLTKLGVPALSPRNVGLHYFDWHHTATDTLDKVEPENFRKNAAVLAVLSYVLADAPQRLTHNGLTAEN